MLHRHSPTHPDAFPLDAAIAALRRARDRLEDCADTARTLGCDMDWQSSAFREAHERMSEVVRALDRLAADTDDAADRLVSEVARRAAFRSLLAPLGVTGP